jgi:hypothetical protein|tara:strand:- start:2 stop:211 length:210 start_codon:yes stop_codon:yes gene_type:complete
MCSHSKEILIWRVHKAFGPLLGLIKSGNPLAEIIVVENGDITIVVADSHMVPFLAICDSSTLHLGGKIT